MRAEISRNKSRVTSRDNFFKHLRFPNDVQAHNGYLVMANHIEDGNAFAIPDLWEKSSLANLEQDTVNPLALGFEPLSISLSHPRPAATY